MEQEIKRMMELVEIPKNIEKPIRPWDFNYIELRDLVSQACKWEQDEKDPLDQSLLYLYRCVIRDTIAWFNNWYKTKGKYFKAEEAKSWRKAKAIENNIKGVLINAFMRVMSVKGLPFRELKGSMSVEEISLTIENDSIRYLSVQPKTTRSKCKTYLSKACEEFNPLDAQDSYEPYDNPTEILEKQIINFKNP